MRVQLSFYVPIFFFLCFPFVAYGQDTGDFHICYFSLNNEKEFTEMEKFTDRLNKHSHCSISVSEYLTEGNDPEESFRRMVESGVRCDGLVISGHHTGSFGGKRSRGSLGIDFLEKLSCDEEYSRWFNDINALWLQGCRTLGTGEIVSDERERDADYHTDRVGRVLEEDHLEQSIAALNMEFSATLDQDNPLSSRYLRAFPAATVFGWTKTAPGERAGSQYSIPFHMAHISRLINNQDGFPKDSPIKGTWTKDSATEYSTAMLGLLNGDSRCQEIAVEAWKNHGKVRDQLTEYGFANPDLNAYTALMNTDDEILKQSRIYDCLLKHSGGDKFLEVLDLVLKDETFIRYTYNTLLEKLQSLKRRDPELHSRVVEKLKQSQEMRGFLNKKLMSRQLGILRKVDYYAFYEEIYGKNKEIRNLILNKAVEAFEKIPSDSYDQRDYKLTLFHSLSKHGYFDDGFGKAKLTRLFKESDSYIKLGIIESGGQWEERWGERKLFILSEGIKDSDLRVRMSATRVAGRIGEEGLPIVREAFQSPDIYLKLGAIKAAGKIGEEGLPIVREAFQSPDIHLKLGAIRAAGRIGKKASDILEKGLPIVEKAAQSSSFRDRALAIGATGAIGEKGLPIVERGLYDSDEEIREIAVESIEEMVWNTTRRVRSIIRWGEGEEGSNEKIEIELILIKSAISTLERGFQKLGQEGVEEREWLRKDAEDIVADLDDELEDLDFEARWESENRWVNENNDEIRRKFKELRNYIRKIRF